ncbi:MAG: LrgB family protein [Nocardioides sp.]|nr:LrgB family protein [Nocardioides sp.]
MNEALDYLRTSPVAGLLLTLVAYRIGVRIRRATGNHPLAQPVLIAVALVGLALWALRIDYDDYMIGGSLIHFLLGSATVALAVPLHRQAHHLKELFVPMAVAIPVGAFVSVSFGILVVRMLGGDHALQMTMAPKSATTPIAIAIAESAGGIPSLVAVFTIVAGMLGAVAGPTVLTLIRVRDRRARGLALGSVSHGIGTSRALHEDATEGAFAGLSMGLTALVTCLAVPLVVHLVG